MQRGMQRMNQNQKPGGRRSRTGVLAANLLWAVAAGLAAAVGATLVGMLILAALVVWAALSDTALGALNQALKLIAIAAGVLCAVRPGGERGLVKGACVGLIYIALGYGVCAIFSDLLVTPSMLALELLMGLGVGALCGAITANLRPLRRRRA